MIENKFNKGIPLRDVILLLMKEQRMSTAKLTQLIRPRIKSNLTMILSGKRSFTLDTLDAITEALGYRKGDLYYYYEPECYRNNKANSHSKDILLGKTQRFILECCKLGLFNLIENLLHQLIIKIGDDMEPLFEIANKLYESGKYHESLRFYSIVVQVKQSQSPHAEALAISFYRILMLSIEKAECNKSEIVEAAIQLSTHTKSLPITLYSHNALKIKAHAYFLLLSIFSLEGKWEKVKLLSEELYLISLENQNDTLQQCANLFKNYITNTVVIQYLSLQLILEILSPNEVEHRLLQYYEEINSIFHLIHSDTFESIAQSSQPLTIRKLILLLFITEYIYQHDTINVPNTYIEILETSLDEFCYKSLPKNPWLNRLLLRFCLRKTRRYYEKGKIHLANNCLRQIIDKTTIHSLHTDEIASMATIVIEFRDYLPEDLLKSILLLKL
ncbi:hypothetical protein NDK47_23815 [Brevibacillus ruminantium]|uniref:HTH cro/C1-type domain-containing protein n=1 Tax=Brevibacillus ruminantium TaxID=2950604 RepID=A0ABY4WD58_9BACL|nr:hypothetical protein [Brevibacillus ruminantium]USG65113.1 hypothetical protein NDK47_23815 [Brevibacillus ruminantium]